MAKIKSHIAYNEPSAGTSFTIPAVSCSVGDLIIINLVRDTNSSAFTIPGDLTTGGTGSVGSTGNNTVRAAWAYKLAASTTEGPWVITWTTSDEFSYSLTIIEGVDQVTPIDASNGNGVTDISGAPYTAASITTSTDNTLIFYVCGADGGVSPTAYPGNMNLSNQDSGACGLGVAWKFQATAGATPTCDFYCAGAADESVLFTYAIRDGSGGTILPGYVDESYATLIHPLKGTNLVFPGDSVDTNAAAVSAWGDLVTPLYCHHVDVSPLTVTNVTTAATNSTVNDTATMPTTEAVGDYFCWSSDDQNNFGGIRVDNNGGVAGVGGVVVFEYYAVGATWKSLVRANGINPFTAAVGTGHVIGWTKPTDMLQGTPDGLPNAYHVRARITTVFTTNPVWTQTWLCKNISCYYDALGASGDNGVNNYEDAINATPGTLADSFGGAAFNFGSSKNLSAGLLIGTFRWSLAKDKEDCGPKASGGIPIALGDASNKWKLWTVGSQDSVDASRDDRNVFAVQLNQAVDTKFYQSGTAPDMSAITKMGIAAQNYNGGCSVQFSQLVLVPGNVIIKGGTSTRKLTWQEIIDIVNSYPAPIIRNNVAYAPIQLGDAANIFLSDTGKSLSFPARALPSNTRTIFHVDSGVVGVVIDVRSGGYISLTEFNFSSDDTWQFTMLATCSASATYIFNGTKITNANVTLRAVFTATLMKFVNCPSFLKNGAGLSFCSFSNTKITAANLADISDCDFTSGGTGHAIELTATGTFNFSGNTFTGYGAGGTTDAAIYNNSGGVVTINLQNYTDQIPTIRNGAGASTLVVPKPNVATVTGIVAGSRIRVRNNTTATTVANEIVAGTSWSLNYQEGAEFSSGDSITVRLTQQSGVTAKLCYTAGAVAGANGWSILAAQEDDDVYADLGVDGSTITNFSADYGNNEIDITVGADFYLSDLYAWYVYNLTTSNGIANFCDGITAIDIGNFRVNTSIVNIKLDNVTATNIYALDNRRFFRDDGARPIRNPTTGTGGIDVEWREQVLFVNSQEITDMKATIDANLDVPVSSVSATVSTGGFAKRFDSFTVITGTVNSGDILSTYNEDGTELVIDHVGGVIDVLFDVTLESLAGATDVFLFGRISGGGTTAQMQFYNYVTTLYGLIDTIDGNTKNLPYGGKLYVANTGTGVDAGKVRMRIYATGVTGTNKLYIDQAYIGYAVRSPTLVNANIKYVNDIAVQGSGTESNPWGP